MVAGHRGSGLMCSFGIPYLVGVCDNRISTVHSKAPAGQALDIEHIKVPQLVGQVYECAPTAERIHLIEHLLRPLGVLSLFAVANGIFAKLWLRSFWLRGWQQDLHALLDDVQNVRASDVVALVDHVQQVSIETVDGLVSTLQASPVTAGSAAAALLVAVLVQRSRSRRAAVDGAGGRSAAPA